MDPNIGKKVKVLIPGYRSVERVLKEDFKGLYIDYKNKRVGVKLQLNQFGENNTNSYVKIHEGGEKNDNRGNVRLDKSIKRYCTSWRSLKN